MQNTTIVVSGCPRSGTTLMMRILHRAGIPCIVDEGTTTPFNEDHPYGTYEVHDAGRVLSSSDPKSSAGKAIKIVAPTIKADWWPTDRFIKVIFMLRDPNEIISSMVTAGIIWNNDPISMVQQARSVLELYSVPTHYVKYAELLKFPKTNITAIQDFLGADMDVEAAKGAIDAGARNKFREEKEIVTFRLPRMKVLQAGEAGSIVGAEMMAGDLTEAEKAKIESKIKAEQELTEANKNTKLV